MTNELNPQPPITPEPPTASQPTKKKSPLVWILVGCGLFVLIAGIIGAGIAWWGYHKAKSYVEKEAGGGMKVAELWPDVPRMDGMDPSHQIDMPVGLKLVAQQVMNTMMKGLNDGKEAGNWDWTAFSLPGKTAADLQAFFTPERMEANGWKQEGGCTQMPTGMSNQATFCAFQKQEGANATGLLIIAANDEENKATSIFFIRQEQK
jgi:hypothetical protein